ncbi:MAG: hypothetical protein ACRCWI_07745 [Brevinema sp.]
MFAPHSPSSPFSLFLGLSLGFHIIGIAFFMLITPKEIPESSIQITLQSFKQQTTESVLANNTTPIQQSTPVKQVAPKKSPKEITPTITKEVIKTVTPKEVIQESPPQKIAPIKENLPKKTETLPTPQKPEPPIKEISPPQLDPPITPNTEPIQPSPPIDKIPVVEQVKNVNKDLSDELEQLLAKKDNIATDVDFLADASWIGTPRKTLSFPNLTASIPQHYKTRGYGFAVTARLTFSSQGWVSSVELVQGSGDPRIDSIFRTELRKIRIEPSSKNSYDTITKTFKVSVK